MTFLQIVFLYFLPAIIIPILIALSFNLNRKKLDFPSIRLIEEILQSEMLQQKFKMRLKQILRVLILLLMILAFAKPVIIRNKDTADYTVIIDDTVSISRFSIAKIISALNSNFRIKEYYFGDKIYNADGDLLYNNYSKSFQATIKAVVAYKKPENIIIVSDGQKVNFLQKMTIPKSVKSMKFLLLAQNTRNIHVKSLSVFPGIAISDTPSQFDIRVGGEIKKSDRISIYLNDKLVLSESASRHIKFSRFIKKSGINFGRVVLSGDDFTNDNNFYFTAIAASKPSVYTDIDSPIILRVLSSLFPEFYTTGNIKFADMVISGSLHRRVKDKPVFLFCEDNSGFENTLRRDFSTILQSANKEYIGNIKSQYAVLNSITDFRVKTKFNIIKHGGENIAVLKTKDNRTIPLAIQFDNYTVLNFSLRDNQASLENSVFLLLLFNDILMKHYREKYILDNNTDNRIFYSLDGTISKTDKPGIYKEKQSGKYMVVNITDESLLDFYNEHQLKNLLGGRVDFIDSAIYDGKGRIGDIYLAIVLMALALGLAVVEVLL